jgi:hypothetical protein
MISNESVPNRDCPAHLSKTKCTTSRTHSLKSFSQTPVLTPNLTIGLKIVYVSNSALSCSTRDTTVEESRKLMQFCRINTMEPCECLRYQGKEM